MSAFNRLLHTIESKIAGRLAIGYHRTQGSVLRDIRRTGFKPSGKGLYGPGLYMTFELESQLTTYMRRYGDYVIKSRVQIGDFLFFDDKVGAAVTGKKDYSWFKIVEGIYSQFKGSEKLLPEFVQKFMNFQNDPPQYSADIAFWAMKICGDQIRKLYKGIEYVGKNDGKCLIVFNSHLNLVKPLLYADLPIDAGTPNVNDIEWETFKAPTGADHDANTIRSLTKMLATEAKATGFKFKAKKKKELNGREVEVLTFTKGGYYLNLQPTTGEEDDDLLYEAGVVYLANPALWYPTEVSYLLFDLNSEKDIKRHFEQFLRNVLDVPMKDFFQTAEDALSVIKAYPNITPSNPEPLASGDHARDEFEYQLEIDVDGQIHTIDITVRITINANDYSISFYWLWDEPTIDSQEMRHTYQINEKAFILTGVKKALDYIYEKSMKVLSA